MLSIIGELGGQCDWASLFNAIAIDLCFLNSLNIHSVLSIELVSTTGIHLPHTRLGLVLFDHVLTARRKILSILGHFDCTLSGMDVCILRPQHIPAIHIQPSAQLWLK